MICTSQMAVWSLSPRSHAVKVGASGSASNSTPYPPPLPQGHDTAAVNTAFFPCSKKPPAAFPDTPASWRRPSPGHPGIPSLLPRIQNHSGLPFQRKEILIQFPAPSAAPRQSVLILVKPAEKKNLKSKGESPLCPCFPWPGASVHNSLRTVRPHECFPSE